MSCTGNSDSDDDNRNNQLDQQANTKEPRTAVSGQTVAMGLGGAVLVPEASIADIPCGTATDSGAALLQSRMSSDSCRLSEESNLLAMTGSGRGSTSSSADTNIFRDTSIHHSESSSETAGDFVHGAVVVPAAGGAAQQGQHMLTGASGGDPSHPMPSIADAELDNTAVQGSVGMLAELSAGLLPSPDSCSRPNADDHCGIADAVAAAARRANAAPLRTKVSTESPGCICY
jgi:hypothetical protein